MTFVKLSSAITRSTIWDESPETCKLWITVLALSDPSGYVASSLPGLAREARLTIEQTEQALSSLCSPDPYSRSAELDGRRLTKVDGGWFIINFRKYWEARGAEEKRQADRERQRRHRAALRDVTRDVTPCHEKSPGEERRGEKREAARAPDPTTTASPTKHSATPRTTEKATEEQRAQLTAYQQALHDRGIEMVVPATKANLRAIACLEGQPDPCSIVRSYVALEGRVLEEAGWPLRWLADRLTQVLGAGRSREFSPAPSSRTMRDVEAQCALVLNAPELEDEP